ncbi:MAG: hypothetical protein ACXWP0_07530 [Ktedonobacterales bacterium]
MPRLLPESDNDGSSKRNERCQGGDGKQRIGHLTAEELHQVLVLIGNMKALLLPVGRGVI